MTRCSTSHKIANGNESCVRKASDSRIDGNRGYACACCTNLSVKVAIIRELAVTKRSAQAAIEHQHQQPIRCEIRKTPSHSCRIRQVRIRAVKMFR